MELAKRQFNDIIRAIKIGDLGRAKGLRTVTFHALRRLGVRRDITKAVRGIPKGSDQFDGGSIVAWINKVQPQHKDAIEQLISIDATLVQKFQG